MTDYDVAILGSGLAGSTLATILARQGLKTLLLERGQHPRFAVGESVVPEFSFRAKLLAAEFDVPEFEFMSNFRQLTRHISSRTGVKRNFTFLHHSEGADHSSAHTCQFQAMAPPLGPDTHIYRADLDEWLTALAIRYGVDYHDRTQVDSVQCQDEVALIHAGDKQYRAAFVVDASGHASIEGTVKHSDTIDLKTDTRTMFTHMTGVKRIDQIGAPSLGVPSPADQGTLHHTFDGGWFWVIPFGNNKGNEIDLASVGLTLDRTRHPENDMSAAEEFASFVRKYPTIQKQFANARAVRSWVKTDRLQYQTSTLSGKRWCLMPHAAGFVDALFSGGMALTLGGVREVANSLLKAARGDGLATADFTDLQALSKSNLSYIDTVIHGAFQSFRSPALFNAYYRIWAIANYHASLGLVRIWLKHRAGDPAALADLDSPIYRGVLAAGQPRIQQLATSGYQLIAQHTAGELSESDTVDALFALLEQQDWIPPQFHIAQRKRRHLASFTFVPMVGMILWGKRKSPEDIRSSYYDVPANFFAIVARYLCREILLGASSATRNLRDAFWSRGQA